MRGLRGPVKELLLNAIWQQGAIKKPCTIIIIVMIKPKRRHDGT